jgi:hypothetical protein
VADQGFGKWGGFLKVDLFGSDVDFCCPVARMSGVRARGAVSSPSRVWGRAQALARGSGGAF